MNIVIFHTKYGDEYYTSKDLDKVFSKVLRDRIEEGCWYYDEEEEKAKKALDSNKAYHFMLFRSDCEYEGFEVAKVENLDAE